MFDAVAVANRGEIAVRVIRTLRRLGLRSVALHSAVDSRARHVAEADVAVNIGGTSPLESYLRVDKLIDAALAAGATALHPGYGFLSESCDLADACAAVGITFIGPSPGAMALMADKITARNTVAAAGVPIVPGRGDAGMTDAELVGEALELGMPVLLKPSAGGGGKGMRVVSDPGALPTEISASRREARAAFGDDTLLIERFVSTPRHIEIQVIADTHGNVLHLGERECSLQRRHQKVIEEAPSPLLTPELRREMGAQAVAVARSCAYTNAGTVEFIVSGEEAREFYFMEMNTRLQVEHPVTEQAFGVDLVEWQLRVAAGETLPWSQESLVPSAHSIEARVYAEDPDHDFLPTGGKVRLLHEPTRPGVRIDSGLHIGSEITSAYDPLLAKVIATAATRVEAIDLLRGALGDLVCLGVTTNVPFLRDLLADPDVRDGRLDTGLIGRLQRPAPEVPDLVVVAAWIVFLQHLPAADPWTRLRGWRLGEPAWLESAIELGTTRANVKVRADGERWVAVVDGGKPMDLDAIVGTSTIALRTRETALTLHHVAKDDIVWLGAEGRGFECHVLGAPARLRDADATSAQGEILSPMPGAVVAVRVAAGEEVSSGQPLVVIEAMKMEHTLTAPFNGIVESVHVNAGEVVGLRQRLVSVVGKEP